MIKIFRFKTWEELTIHENSYKYIENMPYIIYEPLRRHSKDIVKTFGFGVKIYNGYDIIGLLYYQKEDWFEKLLPEDKYDAIWEMHDYD